MLLRLIVPDFVIVDRIELEFGGGFGALTGETGAGKSILLDALGLALCARGDSGLVAKGAAQASVAATFAADARSPVRAFLAERGLDIAGDDPLILRRTLGADGRSRAFVNDQPVPVGTLRDLGDRRVEVHGQFDTHGLLDPSTHRAALDTFGNLAADASGWRPCTAAGATPPPPRRSVEKVNV